MHETYLESFLLSPQQRHLCALLHGEETFPYRTHFAVSLEGTLDTLRLYRAIAHLMKRYEILRTNFPRLPGAVLPIQVINTERPVHLETYDCCSLSLEKQEEALVKIREGLHKQPFNLAEGATWRVVLIRCTAEYHWLLWDMTALNADILTCQILLRELSQCYAEEGLKEQEEPLQYVDLAEWQYEVLDSAEAAMGKAYWRSSEHSLQVTVTLPYELLADSLSPFSPSSLAFELSPIIVACIKERAGQLDVSESSLLLACWGAVLSYLTTQENLLIGTGYDGRKYEELAEVVGPLTKFLPLSYRFPEDARYSEVARQVEKTTCEGYEWQEYFCWQMVEASKEGNDPFYSFGFNYETLPTPWQAGGVKWRVKEQGAYQERFKLWLSCLSHTEGLQVTLHYDRNVFGQEDMQRLLKQWQGVLEQVLANLDLPLKTLQLLTGQERHLILYEWNATRTDVPAECGVHQLFEEQVERTPDSIAVVWGDEQLSYRALDLQANRLAHYLHQQGVGPEVRVGICLPHSPALLIAILSVLKAAGTYVPLEVTCPAGRLAFMLQDARISLLLTQEKVLSSLDQPEVESMCLDHLDEKLGQEECTRLSWMGTALNLAYIIYTSGSTGHPKGVMVTQRGLVNYLHWARQAYGSSQGRGALLHSPISFDLTVTSLFVPLIIGQPVTVQTEEQALETLSKALATHEHWSLLKMTPAHLEALSTMEQGQDLEEATEVLILGGEMLWHKSLVWWRQRAPHCRLINEYGPTETVVGCCSYEVPLDSWMSAAVPIGRPIANMQLYVLDGQQRPVPVGMAGELYIGGIGLARGYLNRPELTAECFVPHLWSDEPGALLYRTGDKVRYRTDGILEYMGRLDQQVKIRGYRIEPGEIEATLLTHPAVCEAVVMARGDTISHQHLVAYVCASQQEDVRPTDSQLCQFLQKTLPDYLIPSSFVWLEALPLTGHGKVDRAALATQEEQRIKQIVANQEPRTAGEEILASIWADVLHRAHVGIHENYFELGGNSLLTIQIITRAQMKKIHITVKDIFQYPTIAQLSEKGHIFKRDWSQAQLDEYQWSFISNFSFSGSSLVNLQPLGSRCPFFCVHAQGGDVSCYLDLARYLGQEQAFYALQAPGLYGEQDPFTSVEELAAYYIEAIRTVQRHGPYLLGGWSFGGLVAFEMARQLREQGGLVADLIIIDRPAPVPGQGAASDDAELMSRLVKSLENYLGRYLSILDQDLQQMSAEEQVRFIVDRVGAIDGIPSDVLFQHIYARFNVLRAHSVATERYVPQTYSGNVTNLCTEQQVVANDQDITLGWRNFVTGNIRTYIVPGSHTTLIYEPHVQVLASVLKTCW